MTEIPLQQHIAPSGEQMTVRDLASCPPPERWHDWMEYDAKAWPRKVEKHYAIIPTICFNCEAACGLMAYVDKETGRVKKFEGNPYHPGSRGRNCAKGPATINQVNDPERILYPLKRTGKRGEGKWERTTWDEVLNTLPPKSAQLSSTIVATRSCIMSGAQDTMATWSACWVPGALTGTTVILTSVHRRHVSATRSGAVCRSSLP